MKIHPHMLRHACGFKLANDGVDTRTIQAYLGHKSVQHTVRYTELAPKSSTICHLTAGGRTDLDVLLFEGRREQIGWGDEKKLAAIDFPFSSKLSPAR
jgi:hypothetical protein